MPALKRTDNRLTTVIHHDASSDSYGFVCASNARSDGVQLRDLRRGISAGCRVRKISMINGISAVHRGCNRRRKEVEAAGKSNDSCIQSYILIVTRGEGQKAHPTKVLGPSHRGILECAYARVCMHVCMYVCIYVCMYNMYMYI